MWDLHAKLGLFWDQIWTLVSFGTKSQIWDFIRAPDYAIMHDLLKFYFQGSFTDLSKLKYFLA